MMNDNINFTSTAEMLCYLQTTARKLGVQYSMNYWDCVYISKEGIIFESTCYSHPHYAVQEIYDVVKELEGV